MEKLKEFREERGNDLGKLYSVVDERNWEECQARIISGEVSEWTREILFECFKGNEVLGEREISDVMNIRIETKSCCVEDSRRLSSFDFNNLVERRYLLSTSSHFPLPVSRENKQQR